jgi:hypothetical protein
MWKFDDARMPTETERQKLSRLMYVAFCDLRALALDGQTQQVKDLAEAFHNIPLLMHTGDSVSRCSGIILNAISKNMQIMPVTITCRSGKN